MAQAFRLREIGDLQLKARKKLDFPRFLLQKEKGNRGFFEGWVKRQRLCEEKRRGNALENRKLAFQGEGCRPPIDYVGKNTSGGYS